ncbi:hemin uptake protein HemP [Thioalkalivibrio sp. ALJ24]|uniref:hemin uptake protein HemP n=1 Tax=Thioalkalivibrio sp. ALJ24 TaxID=545276 RepID=UPI00039E807D|nr:hemin uptake protein HemP [Thioalkalivibrio sp. ALJ24]
MSSSEQPDQPASGPGGDAPLPAKESPAGGPREVTSDELLCDADRVYIHHEGQCYTLRVTASRKLILTK